MSPRLLQVRPFPPFLLCVPIMPPCHALLPSSWVPQDAAFTRSRGSLPGSAPGTLGAWGKVLGRQSLGCEVAASTGLLLLSVQAASPHRPPHACLLMVPGAMILMQASLL